MKLRLGPKGKIELERALTAINAPKEPAIKLDTQWPIRNYKRKVSKKTNGI